VNNAIWGSVKKAGPKSFAFFIHFQKAAGLLSGGGKIIEKAMLAWWKNRALVMNAESPL